MGLHVDKVLKTTKEENLRMIAESIEYLVRANKEVHYDAEDFFDAYQEDPKCARKCVKTDFNSGAKYVVLCDTNGATLPSKVKAIVAEVILLLSEDFKENQGKHCDSFSQ